MRLLPVPQERVSSSTPRSNVRIFRESSPVFSTKFTFAPSGKEGVIPDYRGCCSNVHGVDCIDKDYCMRHPGIYRKHFEVFDTFVIFREFPGPPVSTGRSNPGVGILMIAVNSSSMDLTVTPTGPAAVSTVKISPTYPASCAYLGLPFYLSKRAFERQF